MITKEWSLIENAILETYLKYELKDKRGLIQAIGAVEEYIKNKNPNCFTNNNGARETLINKQNGKVAVSPKDMLTEILKRYIDIIDENKEKNQSNLTKLEYFICEYLNDNFERYIGNKNGYEKLKRSIAEQIGPKLSESEIDNAINKVVIDVINRNLAKIYTVENVKIRPETMEKILPVITSGKKFEAISGPVVLAGETGKRKEMALASSIGLKRKGQEDAAMLLLHPNNPEMKMLVVADGVGGHANGEKASQYAVEQIKKWFEKQETEEYFYDNTGMDEDIKLNLKKINEEICQKFDGGGTTFTASIVGKNTTKIYNTGDSRAYTIKEKEVEQITEDQSLAYALYKAGEIVRKDDIRFFKDANKIFHCLGSDKVVLDNYEINNKDYDILLLTSDGVTDCISDDTLLKVATEGRTAKEIAVKIVEAALCGNDKDKDPRNWLRVFEDKYSSEINFGKDNTTAAVLKKDGGERDGR